VQNEVLISADKFLRFKNTLEWLIDDKYPRLIEILIINITTEIPKTIIDTTQSFV